LSALTSSAAGWTSPVMVTDEETMAPPATVVSANSTLSFV